MNNSSGSSAGNRTSFFETFSSLNNVRAEEVEDDDDVIMSTHNERPVKSVARRSFEDENTTGHRVEQRRGSAEQRGGVGEVKGGAVETGGGAVESYEEGGGDDDVECIEDDYAATLFMSCSPGRGSSDDDVMYTGEDAYDMRYIDDPADVDFEPQVPKPKKKKKQPEVAGNKQKAEEKKPKKAQNSSGKAEGKKSQVSGTKKKSAANSGEKAAKVKIPGVKEPKKPLSSYALFYRDTQAVIKSESPSLSFGEISKIVATMWDRLEPDQREVYTEQAEEDKRSYVIELGRYQEAVKQYEEEQSRLKKKKKKKVEGSTKKLAVLEMRDDSDDDDFVKDDDDDDEDDDSIASSEEDIPSNDEENESKQNLTNNLCLRKNCPNRAVDDPRWTKDYCSSQCVVSHCRDVFVAWVAQRKDNNALIVGPEFCF